MQNKQPTLRCGLCAEWLAPNQVCRLQALDAGKATDQSVNFAFDLCRPCYYQVCHAAYNLMRDILVAQLAQLKQRSQTAGLEI